MHNRRVKFGRKIPNHLGKNATKSQGRIFFDSHYIALNETSPIIELVRGITCHMKSPVVTCHPTQMNAGLNPSQ